MGNHPTIEHKVGTHVNARVDGNQTRYYPAIIVAKHDYGRYDVKFKSNGSTKTVFWDDIQTSASILTQKSSSNTLHNINKKSLTFNNNQSKKPFNIGNSNNIDDVKQNSNYSGIKTFDFSLISDNDLNDNESWKIFMNKFNFHLKNNQKIKIKLLTQKQLSLFDKKQLNKIEQLIIKIGGDSLYKNIRKSNKQKTSKYIIKTIQNGSNKCSGNNKYIKHLKSINIINNDNNNNNNNKYGMQYSIKMDLDYDKTVTSNDNFSSEIIGELSSILDINPSLININSTSRGSVIILINIIGISLILFLFGSFCIDKLSYIISKKRKSIKCADVDNNNCGEALIDINPGDQIGVEYNNKMYDAKILNKYYDINKSWITVEYINKPFRFFNTEKIELNSKRLHIKQPGCSYKLNLYPDEGNVEFEVLPIPSQ